MISLDQRLTIPDSVVFRELEGECIILDLNSNTYFGLDPVGARVWQLLGEHARLGAVLDIMKTEYAVEARQLETDLVSLGTELCAKGLLRVEAAAS